MKIHEYQAIEIFRQGGIPVAGGEAAEDCAQAVAIAGRLGYPVVLKAQVLSGGRGKAGGVKVVKAEPELRAEFDRIRRLTISGYPVERILVVKAVDIRQEYYAAVTIDPLAADVVIIASAAGGVDIEETARKTPEKIHKYYLQGRRDLDPGRAKEFIGAVFPEAHRVPAGAILQQLLVLFYQHDCALAEINPLVVDGEGRMLAADAKVSFDDNALYRHEEIKALADPRYIDADEEEAKAAGLSFVKLEGNVGCIVNGAGLAMATMDTIKLVGGQPANFLDVGGSSSPQKVLNALKIILRNAGIKSILINIFGGITRCDDIANGLIEAMKKMAIKTPLVVRLTGTNEEEAKIILRDNNITTYSSMREAVNKAVELAR